MQKRVGVIMMGVLVLVSPASMHAMRFGCSDDQLDLLIQGIEQDSRDTAEKLLQEGMPLHAVVRAEFCPHHRTESLADMDYVGQSPLYVMARANKLNMLRFFLERGLSGPAVNDVISRSWCRGLPHTVVRLLVLAGINFDNLGPCQGPHPQSAYYQDLACGRHNQVTRADIESAKEERREMGVFPVRPELYAALLFFLPKELALLICDCSSCPTPEDKLLITAPKVVIDIPVALPGEYAP
jgi:hypothetical protein